MYVCMSLLLFVVSMVAMSTFRSNMGMHREGGDMRSGDPMTS